MGEIIEVEVDDEVGGGEREKEFEKLREIARVNLTEYAVRIAEQVQRYAQFRCRALISEGITLGYNSRVDVVPFGGGSKIIVVIEFEVPGWLVEQVARDWHRMAGVFVRKWRYARAVDRFRYGREAVDNTFPHYRSRRLVVEEGQAGGSDKGSGGGETVGGGEGGGSSGGVADTGPQRA